MKTKFLILLEKKNSYVCLLMVASRCVLHEKGHYRTRWQVFPLSLPWSSFAAISFGSTTGTLGSTVLGTWGLHMGLAVRLLIQRSKTLLEATVMRNVYFITKRGGSVLARPLDVCSHRIQFVIVMINMWVLLLLIKVQ